MSYTSSPLDAPQGIAAPQSPALDQAILNGQITELEDGGVEIAPAQPELRPEDVPHGGNLAEVLPDHVLGALAQEVIEGLEADIESNKAWYEQISNGMKILGLDPGERPTNAKLRDIPASRHPILKEALFRFLATATGELLPAAGPVRCTIFGDKTPEAQQRADRKQDYMNYRFTVLDEDYYDDRDQKYLVTAAWGHTFDKVWRDPLRGGEATSRYYTPFDIVVGYGATSLKGSYPYTEIELMPRRDMILLKLKAWFRDVDLMEPAGEDETPAALVRRTYDFRVPSDRPEDADHVVYHRYCMLDLEGLEHRDDDGEPTGLPLPYIVSVDRDSQKVLRVARNWKEGDPEYKPCERFVSNRYMPGFGFLGTGLLHLLGADAESLGALRRMWLTNLAFSSFPGGLRRKGVKSDSGSDIAPGPGEWAEVDTGGAPMGEALMPMPYKDVPASAPLLNTDILTNAQRLGGTSDIATGDMREDALPGTVIALIQRAQVMEGSVVKRLHRAQRKEFRMYADLLGEDSNDGTPVTYPYIVNGQAGQAISSDFADNADIVPVADPNIPTRTERLSIAQADMTVTAQAGGNVKPAAINLLRLMGRTDEEIAERFPQPPQAQPMDPVSEFAAAMNGLPLKAGPAQDHVAHVQAHMGQAASPMLPPPVAQALAAHIGEHTALAYAAYMQAAGVPMAPPGQPVPPQIEGQIAAACAMASDAVRQKMMQLAPPQLGGDPLKAQELQLKAAELQEKQADGMRKALAAHEQNQTEIAKQATAAQMADRENAARIAEKALDLQIAQTDASAHVGATVAQHIAGPMVAGAVSPENEKAGHAPNGKKGRRAG